ncbi:MAG: hypothetical protein HQK96_16545 [Nitrospirae bacterium]|nr:hypothetical protein [Nitrospirota bacterium]
MSDKNEDAKAAANQKGVQNPERPKEIEHFGGPIGLDIGTTNIVSARARGTNIQITKQLNAFFTVPASKITGMTLLKNDVLYFSQNGSFYIIGNAADTFANTFNTDTRRPVESGLLSAKEDEALNVIQSIIKTLVPPPKNQGELVCYSIPGDPIDTKISVLHHDTILKRTLQDMGYTAIAINEGFAVIMSELADESYTGIGISMGGGMCNVCFSYLSVPVFSYSIQKGGDYVDTMVGAAVGESATRIKLIKEKELNLLKEPKNKVETSLSIYYEDLLESLILSIQRVITTSESVPRLSKPISVVLSGGTAMPAGVREKFEKLLKANRLPLQFSSVRMAEDPLNTTAKGALQLAIAEEK